MHWCSYSRYSIWQVQRRSRVACQFCPLLSEFRRSKPGKRYPNKEGTEDLNSHIQAPYQMGWLPFVKYRWITIHILHPGVHGPGGQIFFKQTWTWIKYFLSAFDRLSRQPNRWTSHLTEHSPICFLKYDSMWNNSLQKKQSELERVIVK
jgi:hypothetical protein